MNKWASIFVLLLVVWALLYSFARNPSTPTLRPIAGRDHAPTEDPKSLNNQAVLYYEMGRNEDAKLLFIRALAISEQASGSDNFVTVSILNGLASVYQAMGRYEDAKPLFIRALAISEQANGPDHPDTGTRLIGLANLYLDIGRYKDAQALLIRALALLERAHGRDSRELAVALNGLASVYRAMGRYEDAKPLFIRALAISEQVNGPDHPDTGIARNNMIELYKDMGRFADTVPLLVRTLAVSEKVNGADHPNTGIDRMTLISLYSDMGRYADAAPLLVRALAISEKAFGPKHPLTLIYLKVQALNFKAMGRNEDAVPLLVRALAMSEQAKGSDHADTVTSRNQLADSYYHLDRYADAEPLLVRALAISEKTNGPDHPDTKDRLTRLGDLYYKLGNYEDATSLYLRSLAISEKVNGLEHPATGGVLDRIGTQLSAMGMNIDAEPLFLRALAISEKTRGADHALTGSILTGLANMFSQMGRLEEAKPLYIRALAISEKAHGAEDANVGVSLNNLARLLVDMGQSALAEPLLKRAWRISNKTKSPELEWMTQFNLTVSYADSNPDLAIWHGKQAVNLLQQVRAVNASLDMEKQNSLLQKNEFIYKFIADLLFTQGRLIEGQQVLTMLKESEYFEFSQRNIASDPRTTLAEINEQERHWITRYAEINHQLVSFSKEFDGLLRKAKSGRTNAEEQTRKIKLEADLTVGRQAFEDFMADLKREFTQEGSVDRQQEFGEKNFSSLRAMQGTLRELSTVGRSGTVILHYLMTAKKVWIVLTTPTVQLVRESPISEANLNRQIGQYRQAIASRDPMVNELGKALFDTLIAPVSEDLKQAGAETLMLSLDGSLRYLPMSALYDGEHYLAQRFRIAIFTEAAKSNLKDLPQTAWSLAGFGLTKKIEAFDALPSVKEELNGILQDMNGSITLDNDFTAKAFKTGLEAEPPVVHLASHFVFKPGSEANSFLLMGDGKRLSLKEIREGYNFTNTDLLTLSACETAVGGGRDANGREVEGFGALAQNQGVKGVIATLWSVADKSTGQFMQLFYGYRQQNPGMTKAQAMQMAQSAFIEGKVQTSLEQVRRTAKPVGGGDTKATAVTTTDHPYYWAPFILMGNWL